MRFEILGPMQAGEGDTARPVRGFRQRAVLAVLLAYANQPVPAERLAEIAWDGAPPAGAVATLRTYVMRLRQGLGAAAGSRILTRDPGYLVQAGESEVDASEFEALSREAGAAAGTRDWSRAAASAGRALALWQGRPLADVPCEAVRELWVPRLERLRVQVLEWRAEAGLYLGQPGQQVTWLHELAGQYPLHERFHCFLMAALTLGGRQAEALAAYQDARRILADELGIEPGPEMRQVHEQILAGNLGLYREAAAGPAVRLPGSGEQEGHNMPGPTCPADPDAGQAPGLGWFTRCRRIRRRSPAGRPSWTGSRPRSPRLPGRAGWWRSARSAGCPASARPRWRCTPRTGLRTGSRTGSCSSACTPTPPARTRSPRTTALAGLLAAAGVDPRYLPGGSGGPDRAVAGPDGRAARAAGAGQRGQQRPGRPAAARQRGLPGAGHQPPPPRRPARRGLSRSSCRYCRRGRRGRCSPGWPPAPPPARTGPSLELAELAGFLPLAVSPAGPGLCPAPGLDPGRPGRRDPGGHAHPDRRAGQRRRRVRPVLPAPGPRPAAALPPPGLHPGTSTDAYAAAALAGVPLAEAAGLLDALHGEGLLTETGHRRYGMHDLIRAYARDLAATDPPGSRHAGTGPAAGLLPAHRRPRRQPSRPPGPHQARNQPPRRYQPRSLTWTTGPRRWRGHGPNAVPCWPAWTKPPQPGSTPGSSR